MAGLNGWPTDCDYGVGVEPFPCGRGATSVSKPDTTEIELHWQLAW